MLDTSGMHKVDFDDAHHTANAGKLLTIYAGMLPLTEEKYNRPVLNVSRVFAEIANAVHYGESEMYFVVFDVDTERKPMT